MSNERIIIKGTSDGLIITLGGGVWPGLLDELDGRLGERASFFKGGRVALRLGPRQLTRADLEAVGELLNRHQVTLWAVESDAPATRDVAVELGLEVGLPARQAAAPTQPAGDALVVQRTLRSGQVLQYPGHIIIIGDVNPGAEIWAGGSVVVWGRLRGKVHAGAGENQADSAIVCALELSPSQLRIGQYLALAPADDASHSPGPEMASVQNGQIVAEPWKRPAE